MAANSQEKRPSKESSKNDAKTSAKTSGLGEQPPAILDQDDVLLHKVPGVIFDHVIDHQILTETFKKEDKALERLADIQKSSVHKDPGHLVYKPNPYNKSIEKNS